MQEFPKQIRSQLRTHVSTYTGKLFVVYTLSEAWSGVNWADLMAARYDKLVLSIGLKPLYPGLNKIIVYRSSSKSNQIVNPGITAIVCIALH